MTKELVEVVQADRDAAAELFLADGGKIVRAMNARLGSFDEGPSVQAFARHRLSAEAAIVAWLRDFADRIGEGITPNTLRNCADTLEQGNIRHG